MNSADLIIGGRRFSENNDEESPIDYLMSPKDYESDLVDFIKNGTCDVKESVNLEMALL